MNFAYLVLFILLLPILGFDKLMDVDYQWWRKWVGEEPRQS